MGCCGGVDAATTVVAQCSSAARIREEIDRRWGGIGRHTTPRKLEGRLSKAEGGGENSFVSLGRLEYVNKLEVPGG
eukprot:scaffold4391_cov36-Cyclotella_meneghiniana.AAC.1